MDIRTKETVDVTAPEVVQIVIRNDAKVVWVNVDGVCLFRACRIGRLEVEDQRVKKEVVKDGSTDRSR